MSIRLTPRTWNASPIDALAFGFPFSLVGKQKGLGGHYGGLYSYGIAMLRHFAPAFFVAENVGGLRSADNGATLALILAEMRAAGYILTPHLYKFEMMATHRSGWDRAGIFPGSVE